MTESSISIRWRESSKWEAVRRTGAREESREEWRERRESETSTEMHRKKIGIVCMCVCACVSTIFDKLAFHAQHWISVYIKLITHFIWSASLVKYNNNSHRFDCVNGVRRLNERAKKINNKKMKLTQFTLLLCEAEFE